MAFVEETLGVQRRDKIEIYFYEFGELPCTVSGQGCYRRNTDQIHVATWEGVDHEIVHAVTRRQPFPSLFWEEGQTGGTFAALLGCQLAPYDAALPDMFHGAVFNEAESSRKHPPTYYPSGEVHTIAVTRGGRFRLILAGNAEGRFVGSIEVEMVD